MEKGGGHKKEDTHHDGAVQVILSALKKRGHKATNVRRMVVEAMHGADRPRNIRELAHLVAADEASVYRTVNLLLKEDLAEAIALPDESFVFALKTEHHHHLVCISCNLVTHLACSDEKTLRPRHAPFAKILGHEVTFYGLCKQCG
jgi:Fur family transcriptional regulator, ferric uptake regulator